MRRCICTASCAVWRALLASILAASVRCDTTFVRTLQSFGHAALPVPRGSAEWCARLHICPVALHRSAMVCWEDLCARSQVLPSTRTARSAYNVGDMLERRHPRKRQRHPEFLDRGRLSVRRSNAPLHLPRAVSRIVSPSYFLPRTVTVSHLPSGADDPVTEAADAEAEHGHGGRLGDWRRAVRDM